MTRRTKIEIMVDMLRSVDKNGPIPPTKIIYIANCPAKTGRLLIDELFDKGFLVLAKPTDYYRKNSKTNRRVYKLSPKGKKAIDDYVNIYKIFEGLQ